MDPIDRGIILDLQRNYRVSLRALADKHGVTSKVIRRRIAALEEKGVIRDYIVQVSRAMTNTEILFSLLYTDKSIDDDSFAEMAFAHPNVFRVHYDSFGTCIVLSEYENPEQMMDLTSFFRRLESVHDLEVHSLPLPRGEKKELSSIELRVLAVLIDNPRMPIADIARRSGLTVKRVRRTLTDLIDSEAVTFRIFVSLTSSDASYISYRVAWDPKKTNPATIDSILRERFPDAYWTSMYSAMEPLMWCDFLIDHPKKSEEVVRELRKIPSVIVRNTILVYPPKKIRHLRQEALRRMIQGAGFL
ncbi:MAG: winged helix-turn-helix transcriptional regulator [Candidatus Thorarchaeota archaeon]